MIFNLYLIYLKISAGDVVLIKYYIAEYDIMQYDIFNV